MADTQVFTGTDNLRVEQWADDEFHEYVRMNPLKFLMGTSADSAIHVNEDLTKSAGDRITFSLVTRLKGVGVTGDNQLMGNEEALGTFGFRVEVNQLRNGVVVPQHEQIKTKIDLLDAAKDMLRLWNMEQLRDLFIARLLSPVVDGVTTYDASTVAQRNAWSVANNPATTNQRLLYGAAKGNWSGVHATDLANIDGTADDMHQDIVRLAKRLAQGCDPHIFPLTTKGANAGQEYFPMVMGSLLYRDLQSNMDTVNQNADVRGDANVIFTGDRMRIGNVLCVECPELDRATADGGTNLGLVGAGGTVAVGTAFLLGRQALSLAWAKRMSVKMDEWDYQNRRGVAVAETRGCGKTTFNQFQHGVVTVFASSVGD